MSGVLQYLRSAKLYVGPPPPQGPGVDLSQLHFRFLVRHPSIQTPHSAEIRIFNMNPTTVASIQKEFQFVVLEAGYPGNQAIIFAGEIKNTRLGRDLNRDGFTDTYLDIYAAEGDQGYNYSVMNQSFAAGSSPQDIYNAGLKSMAQYGITGGPTPAFLGTVQYPRGRACFGATRDYLRAIAKGAGANWTINNGQLVMIQNSAYLPGSAVVVNSATGMIGQPQQTEEGISVRMLLNPGVRSNRLLKINNSDIAQIPFSLSYSSLNPYYTRGANGQITNLGLDTDGLYKVTFVDHRGDTRGTEYYSEAVCQGVNAMQSLSSSVLGAVPEF